jgi:hypothetical protein
MIQFQSYTSSGWATATSFVANKPSGLAVGDLMILHFTGNGSSPSFPSGFNAISTGTISQTGGALTSYSRYKIADSGDVAASNFTVTAGSAQGHLVISRFTGHFSPVIKWSWAGGSADNTATPSISASITTNTRPQTMILLMWSAAQTISSLSGYAIANSNPTWTEAYDLDDGSDKTIAMAYAIRPEQTATGNVTATAVTSGSSNDWIVIVVGIALAENLVIADSLTLTENFIKGQEKKISDSIILTDSVTGDGNKWKNEQKNSTTWINESKS